jgi:hypothetical protein
MVVNQHRSAASRRSVSEIYRRGLSGCKGVPEVQDSNEYVVAVLHSLSLTFLVPYSGGSSLEANFSAPYGGMSIDFTFMDKIISLHADE